MSYQEVSIPDPTAVKSSRFPKERDLSSFIVENIGLFCRDVLGDEYVAHDAEVQASKHAAFMPRMPRVDLRIECVRKTYLVELKNPTHAAENRAAIGQVLCYGHMLQDMGVADLVIVTTKFDMLTAKAIKHYSLPIRYVYFDGDKCMEYLRG